MRVSRGRTSQRAEAPYWLTVWDWARLCRSVNHSLGLVYLLAVVWLSDLLLSHSQLITFVHTLLSYEDKLGIKKVLVICPLNTVLNWKDEVDKWTGGLQIDVNVCAQHL